MEDVKEGEDRRAERNKEGAGRGEEKGRQEGRLEGRQEGRLEGERRGAEKTARNLIARTEMEDVMIAEIAGLAVEDVTRLRAEGKH